MKIDTTIIASIISGFNIIASVASLILSGLAIWLSLYFYTKSKDTEKNVDINLHEIKTQSQSLEKLTGRWMDRLTKYVTSPQPLEETTNKLFELVNISLTGVNKQLPNPKEEETKKQLNNYITSTLIAIFYYTSITNTSLQGYLTTINEFEVDINLKNSIDNSYSDYFWAKGTLSSKTDEELKSNALYKFYEWALQSEKFVKTTSIVYTEKQSV